MKKGHLLQIIFCLLFMTNCDVFAGEGSNGTGTMNYIGSMKVPENTEYYLTSSDRKYLVLITKEESKFHVCRDGMTGRGYDKILFGTLTFSPDNKHLAYVAENSGDWFLVIDNREGIHHEKRGLLDQSRVQFIDEYLVYTVIENKILYLVKEKIQ